MRISGTLKLYVGGQKRVVCTDDGYREILVGRKKLCDDKYSCRSERNEIIRRWTSVYLNCEIGIIPDLPEFDD